MTDFVLRGDPWERRRRRLLGVLPGFEQSPEYLALDPSDRALPFIVAARGREYWERLERDDAEGRPQGSLLMEWSNALERLAADSDEALLDLVLELMHNLPSDTPLTRRMRARLGPNALELYQRFIDS